MLAFVYARGGYKAYNTDIIQRQYKHSTNTLSLSSRLSSTVGEVFGSCAAAEARQGQHSQAREHGREPLRQHGRAPSYMRYMRRSRDL